MRTLLLGQSYREAKSKCPATEGNMGMNNLLRARFGVAAGMV